MTHGLGHSGQTAVVVSALWQCSNAPRCLLRPPNAVLSQSRLLLKSHVSQMINKIVFIQLLPQQQLMCWLNTYHPNISKDLLSIIITYQMITYYPIITKSHHSKQVL